MNLNPRETILKILEIIDYPDNKDEFVNQFIVTCKKQAVIDLISKLESDRQDQLKEQLTQATTEVEIAEIFNSFFSDDDYQAALTTASESTLGKLLEAILPDLNNEQKTKLKELLSSLMPQPN
jgi:hypothetical protein